MIPLLLFRITSAEAPELSVSVVEGDASQQQVVAGDASTQGAEGDASKG